MADLSDFIARLEGATASDEALEHEILIAFGARYQLDWGPEYYWPDGSRFYAHRITAKVDDTIALALHLFERPLVGIDNDIPGSETEPRWNAWCHGQSGEHPTSPAIALCLAVLRACKTQNEDGPKQAQRQGDD